MKYILFDPDDNFDPTEMVTKCIENEADSILLDELKTPIAFFDLSSGLLGELLHKISIYRIKLAIIVFDPKIYSESFQSFLAEANRGNSIHSFSSHQDAIDWLEKF